MKNLVIVESPSKSKTIEKYLGKDYKVLSSKGHIRDLSTRGKGGLGVDIDHDFKPDYILEVDKKDVVANLKKEAENADFVYLATDPDREGEAISWHLAEELNLDINEKNRIVFNEITKNAVLNALDNPRSIDMELVKSQETRRILDRIIGFKLSNLLKNKIHSKSAGRVQSVALRMICDKEKEIMAFKPEEYWKINANLLKGKTKIDAELTKYDGKKLEIKNETEANEIEANLNGDYVVSDILNKKRNRSPYLPFITSTLQQEASSKLSFSSKKTMNVAQSLYEGVELSSGLQGLITYMRTDSTRLSKEFIDSAYAYIEDNYGKDYKGNYRVKNDGSSQDAHEAIRPTSLENDPEKIKSFLSNDQYKLYKLIYARALASLMADAKINGETITIENNKYQFTLSGQELVFDGFLKVYGIYDSSKDIILPKLEKGEILKLKELIKQQHFTEAPARYTEAKLIKALEEDGVGRPSTYAAIIDTIQKRAYVKLEKASDTGKTKYFFPTEQGMLTDEKLKEFFEKIINVKYTAQMEKDLDDIALNKVNQIDFLHEFYNEFDPLIKNAYTNMEKVKPEPTGNICPECGHELVYRMSRYGKFISCSNFPTCKYTESINEKKEEPVDIGRECPECGNKLLKRKNIRRGNYFIGCSNYPSCKYTESIPGEEGKGKFYRKKKA